MNYNLHSLLLYYSTNSVSPLHDSSLGMTQLTSTVNMFPVHLFLTHSPWQHTDSPYIYLMYISGCDSGGYCTFPRFLWEPLADGTPRKWLSKTEYFKNTNTWEKQKEITVSETEIVIQHKVHASCNGYETDSAVPCFRQDIIYEIICVSEEPDGKFRIQQKVNGLVYLRHFYDGRPWATFPRSCLCP